MGSGGLWGTWIDSGGLGWILMGSDGPGLALVVSDGFRRTIMGSSVGSGGEVDVTWSVWVMAFECLGVAR